MQPSDPYYKRDLALVHHRGFGFHADMCAPGILELLQPIRERHGVVVEFGCGSGLLTKKLVDAGHRVIATDASPAMLELARDYAAGAEEIRLVALPDDPLPEADAVVGVGHPINYLPDEAAIDHAVVAMAKALRPGGVIAFDICDLEWGRERAGATNFGWAEDDWALVTKFSTPAPNMFVREMTTFIPNEDGSWHRAEERHDNVLVDVTRVPALLAEHGVHAEVRDAFGEERLPAGLKTIIGRRPN